MAFSSASCAGRADRRRAARSRRRAACVASEGGARDRCRRRPRRAGRRRDRTELLCRAACSSWRDRQDAHRLIGNDVAGQHQATTPGASPRRALVSIELDASRSAVSVSAAACSSSMRGSDEVVGEHRLAGDLGHAVDLAGALADEAVAFGHLGLEALALRAGRRVAHFDSPRSSAAAPSIAS